ncbi:hypothetical protein LCGC14_0664020 [marine sediment metagenome]|uniref:Uncharacterized protein n=1 Tax=marine sediment metagenome TaxID=412755 RepID=A0A0F9RCV7_9ZZZZ
MAKLTNRPTQQAIYKECFATSTGKEVLGQILVDAGYFDHDLKTTEELAVLNFVKGTILAKIGLHPKRTDTVRTREDIARRYVNNLMDSKLS